MNRHTGNAGGSRGMVSQESDMLAKHAVLPMSLAGTVVPTEFLHSTHNTQIYITVMTGDTLLSLTASLKSASVKKTKHFNFFTSTFLHHGNLKTSTILSFSLYD